MFFARNRVSYKYVKFTSYDKALFTTEPLIFRCNTYKQTTVTLKTSKSNLQLFVFVTNGSIHQQAKPVYHMFTASIHFSSSLILILTSRV